MKQKTNKQQKSSVNLFHLSALMLIEVNILDCVVQANHVWSKAWIIVQSLKFLDK